MIVIKRRARSGAQPAEFDGTADERVMLPSPATDATLIRDQPNWDRERGVLLLDQYDPGTGYIGKGPPESPNSVSAADPRSLNQQAADLIAEIEAGRSSSTRRPAPSAGSMSRASAPPGPPPP